VCQLIGGCRGLESGDRITFQVQTEMKLGDEKQTLCCYERSVNARKGSPRSQEKQGRNTVPGIRKGGEKLKVKETAKAKRGGGTGRRRRERKGGLGNLSGEERKGGTQDPAKKRTPWGGIIRSREGPGEK